MHQPSRCCGVDTYICQKCGRIFCSKCDPSVWRPDITGHKSAGNVCPGCLKTHEWDNPIESKIHKGEPYGS